MLNVDHRTICRFPDMYHPGYMQVLNCLDNIRKRLVASRLSSMNLMMVPLLQGPAPRRVSGAVTLSAEMQRVILQRERQRVVRLLEGTSISHLLPIVVVSRWWEVVALEETRLVEKRLEAVQSAEVCDCHDGALHFRPYVAFVSDT